MYSSVTYQRSQSRTQSRRPKSGSRRRLRRREECSSQDQHSCQSFDRSTVHRRRRACLETKYGTYVYIRGLLYMYGSCTISHSPILRTRFIRATCQSSSATAPLRITVGPLPVSNRNSTTPPLMPSDRKSPVPSERSPLYNNRPKNCEFLLKFY